MLRLCNITDTYIMRIEHWLNDTDRGKKTYSEKEQPLRPLQINRLAWYQTPAFTVRGQ